MRRTQNALFLAGLLFGSLSLVPSAQAEGDAADTVPPPQVQQQAQGDSALALDANAGSHWIYIGGNYLLITNDVGKILKAESDDIYYRG